MSGNAQSFATIEGVIHNTQDQASWVVLISLDVHFGQKVARIELPAAEPLFAQEPVHEVARRSLELLIPALEEVVTSPGRVYAPALRRT